jgi:indolepyruvate ferredoxin oxidoreductase alpha subunit
MIVLDNKATAASGFQPNPGVEKDAMGRKAPALSIEQIARACGVKHVCTVDLDDPGSDLKEMFCENLRRQELALILIQLQ